ncbi:MAG: ABC transporter permease [Ruminococcus sp.]|nr:ABC transporter permease [Ruminococcus sp.]
MKKALFTDTLREMRLSMGRFIAIFAIIALGCGFFAGLKATMPDMVETAENYFIDLDLMDVKFQSTAGIRSDDVIAVRNAAGVEAAAPGYSKDVFYYYQNQNIVLKVMSLPGSFTPMNTPVLLEGRLPERRGECAVEVKVASPDTFKLGERLTFSLPEGEDILDTFSTDSYEIVGIIASPLYIGYQRDHSSIGSGEVASFVMVPESDFVSEYYTELYVRLEGVRDLDPFSEEYREAVNDKKREASRAFRESVQTRYDKLVSDAEKKISDGEKGLLTLESLLTLSSDDAKTMYDSAKAEYEKGKAAYDALDDKNSVAAFLAQAQLAKAEQQLGMLEDIIKGGEAKEKYRQQYLDSKAELETAREKLAETAELKIYESDRFSLTDYAGFENDAEKIDAISKVFPAFFLLIAALVTLTTMTRMIDEQRTTIGTYKALGYSAGQIVSKYLFYAFAASVLGSVIGTVIGLQVFPAIIYDSYKILYNIPEINTPFRPMYLVGCMLAAMLCTGSAVMYASLKTLRSQPSQLMRPKPPASGRRVLLERVGFIWNRLSFLMKVTVRNLLRYKKRFFMTVAGVAGCTALIITGFALKHSISTIVTRQFDEIMKYDAAVVLNSEDNAASRRALETLDGMEEVTGSVLFSHESCDSTNNGVTQSVNLVVPEITEGFDRFVKLETLDGEETSIGSGALITEKLSMLMGLKAGDSISLKLPDRDEVSVRIDGVVKNYAMHYVYISPECYRKIFGSEAVYKSAYLTLDGSSEENFKQRVVADKQFLGISLKGASAKSFLTSLDSLDSIVLLLIFCAGLLAVIVLYNLANINITERVREIATIKVLGFFDGETSAYIYRENIISTVLGIAVGVGLGKLLHYFVVITAEVDVVLFNRELIWWAYIFGGLFTVLFAFTVNLALHFKLRRIDMVESLKSAE